MIRKGVPGKPGRRMLDQKHVSPARPPTFDKVFELPSTGGEGMLQGKVSRSKDAGRKVPARNQASSLRLPIFDKVL